MPDQPVAQPPAEEEMHFGYPLSILEAHEIDIDTMYMLPEEMRLEQMEMLGLG